MNNYSLSVLVKYFCCLFSCINVTYWNDFLLYENLKHIMLNITMFYSRRKTFRLRDDNETLVILKEFTKDLWLWKIDIKNKLYFLHQHHKRYCVAHCLGQYNISLFCCTKFQKLDLGSSRLSTNMQGWFLFENPFFQTNRNGKGNFVCVWC